MSDSEILQNPTAPTADEMLEIFQCVSCGGGLIAQDSNMICNSCGYTFEKRNGIPILLRTDNELFPQKDYVIGDEKPSDSAASKKASLILRLARYTPSRSINLVREANFERISKELTGKNSRVLVIGCGDQAGHVLRKFENSGTRFIFCDINPNATADVFCDAHELSFKDETVDGVITTAVMEHVMYPEVVAKEIARVTRLGGFVYSETPFLYPVHMKAYDFTRYSLGGHRRLFEDFKEVSSGMVGGPWMVLIMSLEVCAKSLFNSHKLAKAAMYCVRGSLFWLKHIDRLVKNNRFAMDGAALTFFYGRKAKDKTSQREIIDIFSRTR